MNNKKSPITGRRRKGLPSRQQRALNWRGATLDTVYQARPGGTPSPDTLPPSREAQLRQLTHHTTPRGSTSRGSFLWRQFGSVELLWIVFLRAQYMRLNSLGSSSY